MGLVADTLGGLVRAQTTTPTPPISVPWQQMGGDPQQGYLGYSRAYMRNEIVFAAIEMLATSAGEPHIVGRRWRRESPVIKGKMDAEVRAIIKAEEHHLLSCGVPMRDVYARMVEDGFYLDLPNHPLIRLLNNPNPFMSRGQMWGTVVMDRALAGNAYLLKARVQDGPLKGAITELWRLRPDRVKIIPDTATFCKYQYTVPGVKPITYEYKDIIHFKTRHPLNDYYGMPPLMVIASRIDIDDYMRGFLQSFFERGGTGPGSILSVKQKLTQEAKDEIRERFRRQFGGAGGYHEMMILDQAESTYQQMGLNRGLRDALPKEIDAVQEARIAMVFGIPGSILGLLIGYESSSYANKRQDWQVFWDLTMTPLLSDLDDVLNLQLVPDFGAIDEVLFDLSDIRALQEDVDKIHERHRKNVAGGLESWEEGREAIGFDPNPAEGTFLVPSNMMILKAGAFEMPSPAPAPPPPALPEGKPVALVDEAHCPSCGRWVGRNVNIGAITHCPKCNREVEVRT
ncbi:MAG: phage portal protein [Dehalococcoidia bacterium]|nr:phage portal protein [Dehalococcoidia bacterium]